MHKSTLQLDGFVQESTMNKQDMYSEPIYQRLLTKNRVLFDRLNATTY